MEPSVKNNDYVTNQESVPYNNNKKKQVIELSLFFIMMSVVISLTYAKTVL